MLALLAFKRGDRMVCAMVQAPSPEMRTGAASPRAQGLTARGFITSFVSRGCVRSGHPPNMSHAMRSPQTLTDY